MASVERAMAMAAAALLPGLLPTPPRSTMVTPECIIVPPVASNPKFPKPGRADAVERWDAHKNDDDKTTKPRSPASSSCGSTSPGRADSVERWDIGKKKTNTVSSSTSSSSMSSRGSSAIFGERYKRPPSRASSADRWDAHKKPRAAAGAAQAGADQEEQKTIVDEEQPQEDETTAMARRTHTVFSGPSFVASPEPSMLPMPAFLPRRAGVFPLPQFLQAH